MTGKLNPNSVRNDTRRKIVELLAQEPMTAIELQAIVGIAETGVRRHLRILRTQTPKQVYICDWHRMVGKSGLWGAVYAAGNKRDKPEPDRTEARQQASARHYRKYSGVFKARRTACNGRAHPFAGLLESAR
jgi:DNA-binding transcriptional ArsR family regulator